MSQYTKMLVANENRFLKNPSPLLSLLTSLEMPNKIHIVQSLILKQLTQVVYLEYAIPTAWAAGCNLPES
ncbi:hypothetical protein O9G_006055, partial [Rozella allomycis CSF55]